MATPHQIQDNRLNCQLDALKKSVKKNVMKEISDNGNTAWLHQRLTKILNLKLGLKKCLRSGQHKTNYYKSCIKRGHFF
jgi:hypothetical protein